MVALQVEPGKQPDDKKVLVGMGIKRLNLAGHGNDYIEFKVQVPKYGHARFVLHLCCHGLNPYTW